MKDEIKTGEQNQDTLFADAEQEYINVFGDDKIDPDDEILTSTWPDEWDDLEMSAERTVSNRRGKRTHRKYKERQNGRKGRR
ncbi:hypothetical protein DPMN_053235 [Dreissena polymorpha]|uniref:Uncharacterized protein n=1 Tax=Dreissena polymorpha TaxID=45954 RepID=A0A9D4CKZ9_DREPO|nr:hypothetical protein DPMN_053235 [Dreissena polymorpha]